MGGSKKDRFMLANSSVTKKFTRPSALLLIRVCRVGPQNRKFRLSGAAAAVCGLTQNTSFRGRYKKKYTNNNGVLFLGNFINPASGKFKNIQSKFNLRNCDLKKYRCSMTTQIFFVFFFL